MRTQLRQCTDINVESKAARFPPCLVQGDPAFNLISQVSRGFISFQIIQPEASSSLLQVQVVPLPTHMHAREINSLDEVSNR